MQYLGDFPEDATVYIPFNTFTSDDPQASSTITNLADADIKVHKDGSVTQIVTDGATVAINFDGITGNHLITVDTSAHADYAVGSDYLVRIEGTTVDAGTVNAWVGSFSIENRFNDVNVVTVSGTAQTANDNGADINTLLTRIVGTLAAGTHNPASAAQIAVLSDWINGGRLDLLLDAIKVVTDAQTAITPAALVSLIWNEQITKGLYNVGNSAARILRETGAAFILHQGTAQAGGTNTITLDALASAVDDYYNHTKVVLTVGAGIGQEAIIVDYNGTTKVAKIAPAWRTVPDNTTDFEVEPAISHAETGWATIKVGLAAAGAASTITLDSDASAVDDYYKDDVVLIDQGTGTGQSRVISAYNGTTKVATVTEAWDTNPDATSEYIIEQAHAVIEINNDKTGYALSASGNSAVTTDIDANSTQLAKLGTPAGADMSADIAALNDISVADILTTQMTEAYAADGVAPTLAQALFLIQQTVGDFSISGTTITTKKLDGTTTAATYTMDDATTPTSRTRAT